MILYEGKKYKVYTKIDSVFYTGNLKDLYTKLLNKFYSNDIIEVDVEGKKKKAKVLKIERYISTDINGNKTEGIVWTLEILSNPIPLPVLILAINSIVYIAIGLLAYFSLDKVEQIVETSGETIDKTKPVLITALVLAGFYFYLKFK